MPSNREPTISLICECGHESVHSLDRTYRSRRANCPACKRQIHLKDSDIKAIDDKILVAKADLNRSIAKAVKGLKGVTYTPKK